MKENTAKENQTNETFKEAKGRNGWGRQNCFYVPQLSQQLERSVFQIMCLRVSDDFDAVDLGKKYLDNIDAVFDLSQMIRDSSCG